MKAVKQIALLILSTVLTTPSVSQSAENSLSADPSASARQPYSPVAMYTGILVGKREGDEKVSVEPVLGFGNEEPSASRMKIYRAEGLGMASNRSSMLLRDDNASFTLKAPMPRVNGMLSLVGTLYQTPLDIKVTRWIQALSFLATRKVDAEFAYSTRISKSSSFDSVISCSLHPGAESGNANLRADFRYNFNF